ncbi:TPA: carboxy-S-adenosyl-L-methionine synthase CmoA, partial [Campylobacter jejuni]|nr:carboxy-S-adenosyl-L-methionine synthase CmoA [Campylobacter jejuni]
MMKDELFKQSPKKQFEFDKSVASVFDDMINRSVPFYRENLELCGNLLAKILPTNASV